MDVRVVAILVVVDYVITSYALYSRIADLSERDVTEFSDHCPIEFMLHCEHVRTFVETDSYTFDKIVWDEDDNILLSDVLIDKKNDFDTIIENLVSGKNDLNSCITQFSNLSYDI